MTETIYGKINFPSKIDITDPSYDEDIWCRINNFPIKAGEYECYTLTADNEETNGWGDRIARIGIRSASGDAKHCVRYTRVGTIGVDCGMAGFFNCDNLLVYEELISDIKDVYLSDNAFVSSSGYGDGAYDVYVGYKSSELVDIYIDFIGE